MMHRLTHKALVGLVWVMATGVVFPAAARTLKFATLAPEGSAWMDTFTSIREDVDEATGGAITIKAYPGGVLGDDKDVLFKIKVGQLDGAGFTSAGTAMICPAAQALMLPLQFHSYEEVDAVMERMQPHLEADCLKKGYVALGWTEIGFTYVFSKSPIRTLADLRASKSWMLTGDKVIETMFKTGGINGIPVPVSDVLTALQTGLIGATYAPPLAAVAMQWFSRVSYRSDIRLLYTFGGLFVSERSWKKVSPEHQKIVSEITHRRLRELSQTVRESNAEAMTVFDKNGIETIPVTDEGRRDFERISRAAIEQQTGREIPAAAYELVQKYLAEVRAGKKSAP